MRKGVVPDGTAFAVNAFRDAGKLIGLDADQEKSSRCMLLFKHVENLRSPIRVGAIVKGQRDLIRAVAVTSNPVRLGKALEYLVGDEVAICVDREITKSMSGLVLDAQDLALAFHVHVGARRHILQFIGRRWIARHVPHSPQRAVFAPEPPESERLDAKCLSGAHVIEGGYCIEKPDVVSQTLLIEIA